MLVNCHNCEHYYVTWDEQTPHGCRAMGFKSKQIPNIVVQKTTPNLDCLSYKKKDRGKKVQKNMNR